MRELKIDPPIEEKRVQRSAKGGGIILNPNIKFLLTLIVLILLFSCSGKKIINESNINPDTGNPDKNNIRIMFYNVENLFDTYDDSLKNDEEFVPWGDKHWTANKLENKIIGIYKVIMAVGDWEPPVIVGLCEIENLFTLENLINNTPLAKLGYRIIHVESPDHRGIDVALLYRKGLFSPKYYKAINVSLKSGRNTRDILYVKGMLENELVHLFINHWPSRYGGQTQSEKNRIAAAQSLKQFVDSLFEVYDKPNIIISGDFNDEPENISLLNVLDSKTELVNIEPEELYNLSAQYLKYPGVGTYKYQGRWQIFDQYIVSGNLLVNKSGLVTSNSGNKIFSNDLILEKDRSYQGKKPFRTYLGPVYHGGISDHLPVYLDLQIIK